jgi:hypothetical protein
MSLYWMEEMKELWTQYGSILFYEKENLLKIKINEAVRIDSPQANELFLKSREVINIERPLLLVDLSNKFVITKSALALIPRWLTSHKAIAVIPDSKLISFMVKWIFAFRQKNSHLKVFATEKDAIHWLKDFKSE